MVEEEIKLDEIIKTDSLIQCLQSAKKLDSLIKSLRTYAVMGSFYSK
jgi:hypothetical protein